MFNDRHPLTSGWRFLRPRLFGQVDSDKKWIADHYERDADFYLAFLDRRHRCYSQALFASPDESLEDAQTRKLDAAADALGLRPGARVLDVGGGWGAFTEHGGRRGLHVTSLTISKASEQFIQGLIDRQSLPCRVLRQHLMEHESPEPYDGIGNLGVTEHLPDYPATLKAYQRLLKPGGFIYLDASAARESHDYSAFLLRHLFPGNGTTLCLHTYLEAVANSPFEVLRVHNDRENYRLTAWHWACNLDARRAEIEGDSPETFARSGSTCGAAWTQRDMVQAYPMGAAPRSSRCHGCERQGRLVAATPSTPLSPWTGSSAASWAAALAAASRGTKMLERMRKRPVERELQVEARPDARSFRHREISHREARGARRDRERVAKP